MTFLIVVAAAAAAIRVAVVGGDAAEAARTAAVHGARHGDEAAAAAMAATLFPGFDVEAWRLGDSILVVSGVSAALSHPDGEVNVYLRASASMPIAPFRSDRG